MMFMAGGGSLAAPGGRLLAHGTDATDNAWLPCGTALVAANVSASGIEPSPAQVDATYGWNLIT